VFILQCLTALDLSVVMLRLFKQSSQGILTVPLVGVTICDEHACLLGIYQCLAILRHNVLMSEQLVNDDEVIFGNVFHDNLAVYSVRC